jgi:hypothetical protein
MASRSTRQLNDFMDAMWPPGAFDLSIRLKDLDQEGVWSQLAFPSMGFWSVNITEPELAREVCRAWNDWALEEVMSQQDRIFTPAIVSTADVQDAITELERARGLGFQAIFLPCGTRPGEEWGLDVGSRSGPPEANGGPRLPHRDRRRERRLPRPGRCRRELHGDHLPGHARGLAPGRRRCPDRHPD